MGFVRIKFNDPQAEAKALGYLAGRFSYTTWNSGETLIPESALAALARHGFSYTVVGPPTYAEAIPALRVSAANQLQ
jgi:hypothetical protein